MPHQSLFIISVVAVAAVAGDLTSLECPLPGGAASATPSVCRQYSACGWDPAAGCRLNDQVGYVREGTASRRGGDTRTVHLRRRSDVTMFGGDVQHVLLTETWHSSQVVRLTFRDANASRYEVPLALNLPRSDGVPPSDPVYNIELSQSDENPFLLRVLHGATDAFRVLPQLIYSDQFIEVTLIISGQDVYGMGENNHDSFRHDPAAGVTWPIFPVDRAPGDGHENLYGAHPFFVAIEGDSGASFGMLFVSSNAMEYKIFNLQGSTALTFRTIGGVLDMLVFLAPTPLQVLKLYHSAIGLPTLPAYWALGFQLSRFGYHSTDDIRAIHARNRAAGIPQDVQYSDIDYMDTRRDFTLDGRHFGDLAALVHELREQQDVHVCLIYDPAIAIDFGQYPTVDRGIQQDVFVRWMNASLVPEDQCQGCGDYVVGYVWPRNKTLFPDFFQKATVEWWTDEMRRFSKLAGGPDGFWIDMNEPSNFGTNMDKPFNWPKDLPPWSLKCPHNRLDSPPYPTMYGNRDPMNDSKRISDKTICMSALHRNDVFPAAPPAPPRRTQRRRYKHHPIRSRPERWRWYELSRRRHRTNHHRHQSRPDHQHQHYQRQQQQLSHYDVHSLYGWSETHATRAAMTAVLGGRRGLLVGRSTYPGAGRWGAHWTGDNTSRWKDLKRSIVGMLEFNMFGIPHVGADICGFNGNATELMCLRWMQLGAFYPFCRNHNTDDGVAQDPAAWPTVAAAARQALGLRYQLLPYLYTLMCRAALQGGAVVRPLAFQWPSRRELRGVDTQFLWGANVMVAPVLDGGDDIEKVTVTFPPADWYDLRDGSLASSGRSSRSVPYHVPLDQMIPVFARGGAALPMQEAALTTAASRRAGFTLAVFGTPAKGELLWDDGETSGTLHAGSFYHCRFHFSQRQLQVLVVRPRTKDMETPFLQRLMFFGVAAAPSAVTVDGVAVPSQNVHYDKKILTVKVNMFLGKDHLVDLQEH